MPSEKDSPPFKRGDLVISGIAQGTVREGQKVRVIECVKSTECGSGWLVTATSTIKGRMAQRPSIAIEGIDSDWFTPAKD